MKAQLIAAAGLFYVQQGLAQAVLDKGTGFGTYYYDIEKVKGACGNDFSNQNQGFVECSFSTPLSLNQMDTNYVVAMNHTLLSKNLAKYCGKKVVVTVNGVQSNLPLFIGDGCERCGTGSSSNNHWNPTGAPGLDFSYSVLSQLSPTACFAGHVDLQWQILDETLYKFDTNGPIKPPRRSLRDLFGTRSGRTHHRH